MNKMGITVSGQSCHHTRVAASPSNPLVVLSEVKLRRHLIMEMGNVTQCLLRIEPSHVFSFTRTIRSGGAIVAMFQSQQEGSMLPSQFYHVIAMDAIHKDEVVERRTLATHTEENGSIGISSFPVSGVVEVPAKDTYSVSYSLSHLLTPSPTHIHIFLLTLSVCYTLSYTPIHSLTHSLTSAGKFPNFLYQNDPIVAQSSSHVCQTSDPLSSCHSTPHPRRTAGRPVALAEQWQPREIQVQ